MKMAVASRMGKKPHHSNQVLHVYLTASLSKDYHVVWIKPKSCMQGNSCICAIWRNVCMVKMCVTQREVHRIWPRKSNEINIKTELTTRHGIRLGHFKRALHGSWNTFLPKGHRNIQHFLNSVLLWSLKRITYTFMQFSVLFSMHLNSNKMETEPALNNCFFYYLKPYSLAVPHMVSRHLTILAEPF